LKRDNNSDGNSENPTNFYYKEEINNPQTFNLDKSFYDMFGNFDQLTINNYKPGDGIPPHIDTHSPFEDMFCSLSLNSGAVMTFILKNEQQHVYLKPRSLAIFTREARFCWEHMIAQRKLDKVEDNIIFRKRRYST
jgi:alkylated DNA repair dioxygenase AlkB